VFVSCALPTIWAKILSKFPGSARTHTEFLTLPRLAKA
jgi:hypothetical protein